MQLMESEMNVLALVEGQITIMYAALNNNQELKSKSASASIN